MKDKQEEILNKMSVMNDDIVVLKNQVKANESLVKKYLEQQHLLPIIKSEIKQNTKRYDKKLSNKDKEVIVKEIIVFLENKGIKKEYQQKVFSTGYRMLRG